MTPATRVMPGLLCAATKAADLSGGVDGIMVMPMTMPGIGWMRRRTSRRRRVE